MSETDSSYVDAMLVQARDYETGRAKRWKAKAIQLEAESARLREALKPAADAMESVARRLPAYSPPAELLLRHAWTLRAALGTEARSAETGTGSVEDEGLACKATPEATPQQPPSPTTETDPPMSVEKARDVLEKELPPWPDPKAFVGFLRQQAQHVAGVRPVRIAEEQRLRGQASRIEAALRTLQAAGEVR